MAQSVIFGIIVLIAFTSTWVHGIRVREGLAPEVNEKNNGKEEDPQSYSLEELQNVYVPKYLESFEEIQQKMPGEDMNDAMELVKLFIVQSWIYTLQPDLEVLRDLFPLDENSTIEDTKQEVIRKIRNRDKITPAADAILLYINSIEEDVKSSFKAQADALNANLDSIVKKVESENDQNKRKELIKEKNEKIKDLHDISFCLGFHKIARKMCLQSYVLDFVGDTMNKNIVLTSTNGSDKKEFVMPPLKAKDFWSFVDEPEIERDNVEKS